jgi:hypothetical protein
MGYIWTGFTCFFKSSWLLSVLLVLSFLPPVAGMPSQDFFPDIPFQVFSQFISSQFSSHISLATVLTVLFTVTSNSDLLNLHARQQNPTCEGEVKVVLSGWIIALARALESKLEDSAGSLFQTSEHKGKMSTSAITNAIGSKLDAFSKILGRYPYDHHGQFTSKLQDVSTKEIEPIYLLCPNTMECETMECNPRSLLQATRVRDIPQVTLIMGTKIHDGAHVLTGKCPDCHTTYYADHERAMEPGDERTWNKVHLNAAKYLKVGQSTWVDRAFSSAVLNGMYSFHASSSAYMEYWNDSFWAAQEVHARKLSRRQIWHTFVQESMRMVASASNTNIILQDGLPIDQVVQEVFHILGENGLIRSADQHACSECTHQFKQVADMITGDDPAAIVGVDEDRVVPVLVGENAGLAAQDAAQAREHANQMRDEEPEVMDVDAAPVKLVVMDGIVMGHTVGSSSFS